MNTAKIGKLVVAVLGAGGLIGVAVTPALANAAPAVDTSTVLAEGNVAAENGTPVKGATVRLYRPDFTGTPVGKPLLKTLIAEGRSDKSGKYAFRVQPDQLRDAATESGVGLSIEVTSGAGGGFTYLKRSFQGGAWRDTGAAKNGRARVASTIAKDIVVKSAAQTTALRSAAVSSPTYCYFEKDGTSIHLTSVLPVHSVAKTTYSWSYGRTAHTSLSLGFQNAPGGDWQLGYHTVMSNTLDSATGYNPIRGSRHQYGQTQFRYAEWTLKGENPSGTYCSNMGAVPGGRQVSPEAWTGGVAYGSSAPQIQCDTSWPAAYRAPQPAGSYFTKASSFTELLSNTANVLGYEVESQTTYGSSASIKWQWHLAGYACGDYQAPTGSGTVYVG